jgi:16S rRNA (cytidine1402-2'-O)-methyltransferase
MKNFGKLYLIPTSLSKRPLVEELKSSDIEKIATIKNFIVETPKVARTFFKGMNVVLQELDMRVLDEHSSYRDVAFLLEPIIQGLDVGLMSDAGSPGIADPGSLVVRECHRLGIQVIPLVGPSSILLSIMGSGLNGQSFTFHGYLHRDPQKRRSKIKQLERESLTQRQTQIFIETPYRNKSLLNDLLEVCHPNTDLTLASDLTGLNEFIKTKSIKDWRLEKDIKVLDIPTIYLILANQ